MKITKKNKKEVNEEITKAKHRCWASTWDVGIEFLDSQPADKENIAAKITPDPNYKCADLEVYPHFFKLDVDHKRLVATHEILHCVMSPLRVLVDMLLDGVLVTRREVIDAEESIVSHLSNVLIYGKTKKT